MVCQIYQYDETRRPEFELRIEMDDANFRAKIAIIRGKDLRDANRMAIAEFDEYYYQMLLKLRQKKYEFF